MLCSCRYMSECRASWCAWTSGVHANRRSNAQTVEHAEVSAAWCGPSRTTAGCIGSLPCHACCSGAPPHAYRPRLQQPVILQLPVFSHLRERQLDTARRHERPQGLSSLLHKKRDRALCGARSLASDPATGGTMSLQRSPASQTGRPVDHRRGLTMRKLV